MPSKGHDPGAKDRVLRTYTIYWNPREAPGRYVVRGFSVYRGNGGIPEGDVRALAVDSLYAARQLVPGGLMRFPAHPNDDPSVVETWL